MDETKTHNSNDALSKFKTKPFKHQLECLNKFGRIGAWANLSEMGTGKTWIAVNNMADLWANGECMAVIVFAPNGVHSNWTRLELPKHMPDWARYRSAAWSASTTKEAKAEIESLYQSKFGSGELRILTMNWEALQGKRGFEAAERFCRSATRLMIICDESDAIKNPSAARTKALMKLKKYSTWRRIMSGTPINNSPFDAFSQFTFLDENILGTTSFYAFRAEYAELLQDGNPLLDSIRKRTGGRFSPQVVARGIGGRPKYKNLSKLAALIEPYSFRVLKKDCLDLPDKIYKTLLFDLTKQQLEIYDRAEKECRLTFEGNDTPFNKLVSLTKLAQITSGYYIHPLADTPVRVDGRNPKLDLLIEQIERIVEREEKVIVWARYRIEIEDIVMKLRALGISTAEYHGGTSAQDRVAAIEAFERGERSVFVGNQQAGGTGITLVAASYVIYFSNDFSLRNRLQSEDRAHRIGQVKNVTYINIAAKGTVDEAVVRALSAKKGVADAIIDSGRSVSDTTKVKDSNFYDSFIESAFSAL